MAEKNTIELNAEEATAVEQVLGYKKGAEQYIIGVIYQKPELICSCTDLKVPDFDDLYCKVFFAIAHIVLIQHKLHSLNAHTIDHCLYMKPSAKKTYEELGGWESISKLAKEVSPSNLNAYITELMKWKAVLNLHRNGFRIANKLSEFVDMNLDEIYNECQNRIDSSFANIPEQEKACNPFENMAEFIEEMDAGTSIGMPLSNAELLSNEICGINVGHIYGLGACSGVGKSTMAFNYLVPSIIKNKEKIVFLINEESEKKFLTELLVWVANNVVAKSPEEYLRKEVLRKRGFDEKTKKILSESRKWINALYEEAQFYIVPLPRYSAKTAIGQIRRYAAKGFRYFVIDTLKESCDASTDDITKSMKRDIEELYSIIRSSAMNVALFVTYQLNKPSIKTRHLTNNEIGHSKSIVDVMSANLMMRRPFDDEFERGRKALKCWREEDGKRIEFTLQKGKQYMITFIAKNRFGRTDDVQIVSECDLGTNVHRDIGYCKIA